MSLQRLPAELLYGISEYLPQKDISALVLSARKFQLLNPILYGNDFKYHKSSALFWGAKHGLLDTVKMAVHAGGDVNDVHRPPPPPLMPPRLGDPVRYSVRNQHAPIHLAAINGHDDIIEYLLGCGASLEPLSLGLCHCGPLVERISTTQGYQAVSRPQNKGPIWSALHLAICSKNVSTVQLLIARGASLGAPGFETKPGPDGRLVISAVTDSPVPWPLHSAAQFGLVPVIRLLQQHGVNPNVTDESGFNAMHYVSLSTDYEMACLTINALRTMGVNLEAKAWKEYPDADYTPLLAACDAANFDAAQALLDTGADPNIYGPSGTSLLFRLKEARFRTYHSRYFDRTYRVEDDESYEPGRLNTIAKVIDRGVNLEAPVFQSRPRWPVSAGYYMYNPVFLHPGATLLIAAVTVSYVGDMPVDDQNGPSSANATIQPEPERRLAEVRHILKLGVNVDGQDLTGGTALLRLMQNFTIDLPVVQSLIEAGANVNHRSHSSKTAVDHLADTVRRRPKMKTNAALGLLLERGATIHEKGRTGSILLSLADMPPTRSKVKAHQRREVLWATILEHVTEGSLTKEAYIDAASQQRPGTKWTKWHLNQIAQKLGYDVTTRASQRLRR